MPGLNELSRKALRWVTSSPSINLCLLTDPPKASFWYSSALSAICRDICSESLFLEISVAASNLFCQFGPLALVLASSKILCASSNFSIQSLFFSLFFRVLGCLSIISLNALFAAITSGLSEPSLYMFFLCLSARITDLSNFDTPILSTIPIWYWLL